MNLGLNYNPTVKTENKPERMNYKQAMSMQATVNQAMANRSPQNTGAQIVQPGTSNGFGRVM